jgi:hypothetical protein
MSRSYGGHQVWHDQELLADDVAMLAALGDAAVLTRGLWRHPAEPRGPCVGCGRYSQWVVCPECRQKQAYRLYDRWRNGRPIKQADRGELLLMETQEHVRRTEEQTHDSTHKWRRMRGAWTWDVAKPARDLVDIGVYVPGQRDQGTEPGSGTEGAKGRQRARSQEGAKERPNPDPFPAIRPSSIHASILNHVRPVSQITLNSKVLCINPEKRPVRQSVTRVGCGTECGGTALACPMASPQGWTPISPTR